MEFHPDRNPNNKEAEEKFKEISAAYEVLGDESKKAKYDQWGDVSNNPNPDFNQDIFDEILKRHGFDFFGGRSKSIKGEDIQKTISLDFMDAIKGCTKNIKVSYPAACKSCNGNGAKDGKAIKTCENCRGQGKVGRRQGFMQILSTCPGCSGEGFQILEPCTACSGNGAINKDEIIKVNIPVGVDDTTTMRLAGKGFASDFGGPPGDLYLLLRIIPHSKFKRIGSNIQSEEEISYLDAILGTKIKVETVQGIFDLNIPAGTQPNAMLKIAGKGVESKNKGDHIVNIKVKIPKAIPEKEKELLNTIRSLRGNSVS